RCFANNKPWITSSVKGLLNNQEELKSVQRELKVHLRETKESYRRKVEQKLRENNMSEVWSGMKTITGYMQRTDSATGGDVERANEFNTFYSRFDCPVQLRGIQHLFNLSLKQEQGPVLWKTSCLVPVPKNSSTSSLSDYRPGALTSHVMKVLEKQVLSHLRPQVSSFLDPLQFAYHPNAEAVLSLGPEQHLNENHFF
ncbi:hypothetical protein NFI96_019941, partial [Prochilodus magdalenae]